MPLETFTGGVDEAGDTNYVLEDGNLGVDGGGGGLDSAELVDAVVGRAHTTEGYNTVG